MKVHLILLLLLLSYILLSELNSRRIVNHDFGTAFLAADCWSPVLARCTGAQTENEQRATGNGR